MPATVVKNVIGLLMIFYACISKQKCPDKKGWSVICTYKFTLSVSPIHFVNS